MKVKYSQHVRQVTEYETRFTIQCKRFRHAHAFTNKIIREELAKSIRNSENSQLWNDRQDTAFRTDVFFIENDIKTTSSITVYFNLILTRYSDDTITNINQENNNNNNNNNKTLTVSSKLSQTIRRIGEKDSGIQNTFLAACYKRMKLGPELPSHKGITSIMSITKLKILRNETRTLDNAINIDRAKTHVVSHRFNEDAHNLAMNLSSSSNGNVNVNVNINTNDHSLNSSRSHLNSTTSQQTVNLSANNSLRSRSDIPIGTGDRERRMTDLVSRVQETGDAAMLLETFAQAENSKTGTTAGGQGGYGGYRGGHRGTGSEFGSPLSGAVRSHSNVSRFSQVSQISSDLVHAAFHNNNSIPNSKHQSQGTGTNIVSGNRSSLLSLGSVHDHPTPKNMGSNVNNGYNFNDANKVSRENSIVNVYSNVDIDSLPQPRISGVKDVVTMVAIDKEDDDAETVNITVGDGSVNGNGNGNGNVNISNVDIQTIAKMDTILSTNSSASVMISEEVINIPDTKTLMPTDDQDDVVINMNWANNRAKKGDGERSHNVDE